MAASRRTRLTVTLVVVVAVVGALVLVARALWDTDRDTFSADTCTFGQYDVDPEQASVAATMIGAVTSYKTPLPERAQVLVLAAGLQESKLRNIPAGQGDRDSVGVLQQRPSQGWGSAASLADVRTATTKFLDALVKVDGWESERPEDAIQKVQISIDGSLYAQHVGQATEMAAALSGRTPAGVTCEFDKPSEVAPASTVATQAGQELGITTPIAAGTRTVRVPGAGWQTAAWFVCNADRLGIDSVAYDGREWSRDKGWQRSSDASAAQVVATMARV